MQVSVAIAGVERLDGNRDQELTLALVADALAARGVAAAVGLMQRVRDVVGEGALLQNPLVVSGKEIRQGEKREEQKYFLDN